jgi:hypothetical protein
MINHAYRMEIMHFIKLEHTSDLICRNEDSDKIECLRILKQHHWGARTASTRVTTLSTRRGLPGQRVVHFQSNEVKRRKSWPSGDTYREIPVQKEKSLWRILLNTITDWSILFIPQSRDFCICWYMECTVVCMTAEGCTVLACKNVWKALCWYELQTFLISTILYTPRV